MYSYSKNKALCEIKIKRYVMKVRIKIALIHTMYKICKKKKNKLLIVLSTYICTKIIMHQK